MFLQILTRNTICYLKMRTFCSNISRPLMPHAWISGPVRNSECLTLFDNLNLQHKTKNKLSTVIHGCAGSAVFPFLRSPRIPGQLHISCMIIPPLYFMSIINMIMLFFLSVCCPHSTTGQKDIVSDLPAPGKTPDEQSSLRWPKHTRLVRKQDSSHPRFGRCLLASGLWKLLEWELPRCVRLQTATRRTHSQTQWAVWS